MAIRLANNGKAQNQPERIQIATGAYITPTAAPGSKHQLLAALPPGFPNYVVDHAEASVVSPDGRTILVLTSGYNQNFARATPAITKISLTRANSCLYSIYPQGKQFSGKS